MSYTVELRSDGAYVVMILDAAGNWLRGYIAANPYLALIYVLDQLG
jgi:hypothetical protein